MKKLLYILVIGLIASSCGGGGGDEKTTNSTPTVPTLVYPTDNLLCIDNSVEFKWNASTDADGETITYQLQVATDSDFTSIAHTLTTTSLTQTVALDEGVAYYFRVKATDTNSASSEYSSVNQFYTEGVGVTNYLPFTPTLVSPAISAVVQTSSVTLSWTASDVDNDVLTYDVYFGEVTPPTEQVATSQSATTLDVSLDSSKTYYWNVVVKDSNGGEAIGQVWKFTTD